MSRSTKFEFNTISGLCENAWKVLNQTEARKRRGYRGAWPKVNQAWECLQWVGPPNLSSIRSVVYLQIGRNCSTNQRSGIGANSAGRDQRLIRQMRSQWVGSLNLAMKRREFDGMWPKVSQAGGGPEWVYSPNLSSIWSNVYLKMFANCSTNQRPGNSGNLVERVNQSGGA